MIDKDSGVSLNVITAFIGASLAAADEWSSDDRGSDEILAFLRDVIEHPAISSEDITHDDQIMLISLLMTLKKSVESHSEQAKM